jgi:hypothetical protein
MQETEAHEYLVSQGFEWSIFEEPWQRYKESLKTIEWANKSMR